MPAQVLLLGDLDAAGGTLDCLMPTAALLNVVETHELEFLGVVGGPGTIATASDQVLLVTCSIV